MKNVRNKKKTAFLSGLSKPARIAVIATAALLLAALLFGIVWTNIDHSYRYDRVDLTQFFKDGQINIDFDGLNKLPIMLATDVSTSEINAQIDKNLQNISGVSNYKKQNANVLPDRFFNDTVYMYYEVYRPATTDGGKDTLLTSNTAYFKADSTTHEAAAGGASVVRLGKHDFNTVLEDWMLKHPEFGTGVDRLLDADTLISEYPGYTLVLDVKATYTKDEATKTYISLPNYYFQPNTQPADLNKSYYKGNDTVTSTAYDSSVKKGDADVLTTATELAKALTKIGEKRTATLDATIDTGTDTYPTTVEVTLKAMFLAEQKVAEIDLDAGDFKDATFTYKADGKDQKVTDGKLKIRLTVESVLSLDKETVTVLAKDREENGEIIFKTGFTAPTAPTDPEALASYNEDNAYASAYMDYVKADMMKTSREAIEKEKETYLATVKSTLWKEIVKKYSSTDVISSLPEEELKKNYDATLAYHKATYEQSYTKVYASLEEYILKAVYSEQMEEDGVDYTKLDASAQAAKVKAYIEGDLREAMCEKILLFAIAEHYGIKVSGAERRAYKRDYRNALASTYESYYKQIYASSMSAGEIRIMAEDQAKSDANSYTKTYYRECVFLRKVQETILPTIADYEGTATWVLEDDPALED